MIKLADKGRAIVVMDITDYNQEGLHQLVNGRYHCSMSSDPTETLMKQIQFVVMMAEAQD